MNDNSLEDRHVLCGIHNLNKREC